MREIKFRIWDEKYNCWEKQSLELIPNESLVKQGRVIQQYIGLKDKDGKEIFEGDIVEYESETITHKGTIFPLRRAEIVFSNATLGFVLNSSGRHNIDERWGDYVPMHRGHKARYSVLGNIFENPELLVDKPE